MSEFKTENYYILQAQTPKKDNPFAIFRRKSNGIVYFAATLDSAEHGNKSFEDKIVVKAETPAKLGAVLDGYIEGKLVDFRFPFSGRKCNLQATFGEEEFNLGGLDEHSKSKFWKGYVGRNGRD